jgi:hypothetical protein
MYRIVPDTSVSEQIAALPDHMLTALAEVIDVLRLTPWNGQPQHLANPDGPVRRWAFGPGHAAQLVYLILEDQQEVHLLLVQHWG